MYMGEPHAFRPARKDELLVQRSLQHYTNVRFNHQRTAVLPIAQPYASLQAVVLVTARLNHICNNLIAPPAASPWLAPAESLHEPSAVS
jgi:hypothetical protein